MAKHGPSSHRPRQRPSDQAISGLSLRERPQRQHTRHFFFFPLLAAPHAWHVIPCKQLQLLLSPFLRLTLAPVHSHFFSPHINPSSCTLLLLPPSSSLHVGLLLQPPTDTPNSHLPAITVHLQQPPICTRTAHDANPRPSYTAEAF